MNDLIPFFLIGITSGSIYGLAAIGLVLTFRTSGIFNFAHGAQAAVAAYVFFEFYQRQRIPWPLAAILALALVGGLGGLLLERIASGLAGAPTVARVAATIGLLVGTQAQLENLYGNDPLHVPFFLPTRVYELPGVAIRLDQIIVTVLALGSTLALYTMLRSWRFGVAMQATVEAPELVDTWGTNPVTVRRYAWVIGSFFASLSGILLAPITGLNSLVLTLVVFQAFGAAAVGAFRSIPLAYVGGLAIGIGTALLTKFLGTGGGPLSGVPSSLPFIVLFLALIAVPRGRLREPGGEVMLREPSPTRKPQEARSRSLRIAFAGVAGLLILPHVVEGAKVSVFALALGYTVIFASLALLVRVSGQISLCQIAFAAVGAVTFGHASGSGIPWIPALVLSGLAAVPAGIVVAVPAFRLSGLYLAIATFGFGVLVRDVFYGSSFMFGSFTRVLSAPRPRIAGMSFEGDVAYYYLLLGLVGSCLALLHGVSRSRLGRLLRAVAHSPQAVEAHGVNTNITKFYVFCISAFFAGVGGALVSPVSGTISRPSYEFSVSLLLVAVLFIAGRRPILAPLIAAGLFIVVPAYITSLTLQQYLPVAFGGAAVIAALLIGRERPAMLEESERLRGRITRSPIRARLASASERPQ